MDCTSLQRSFRTRWYSISATVHESISYIQGLERFYCRRRFGCRRNLPLHFCFLPLFDMTDEVTLNPENGMKKPNKRLLILSYSVFSPCEHSLIGFLVAVSWILLSPIVSVSRGKSNRSVWCAGFSFPPKITSTEKNIASHLSVDLLDEDDDVTDVWTNWDEWFSNRDWYFCT